MEWLALSPHSRRLLGLNPDGVELCMFFLGFSFFPAHTKDEHVRLTGG